MWLALEKKLKYQHSFLELWFSIIIENLPEFIWFPFDSKKETENRTGWDGRWLLPELL